MASKFIAFALFAALLAQPVASFAGQALAAPAQAPKNAVASPEMQKEFSAFIAKFRAALKPTTPKPSLP